MPTRKYKFTGAYVWVACGALLIAILGKEISSLGYAGIAFLFSVGLIKALDAATTSEK